MSRRCGAAWAPCSLCVLLAVVSGAAPEDGRKGEVRARTEGAAGCLRRSRWSRRRRERGAVRASVSPRSNRAWHAAQAWRALQRRPARQRGRTLRAVSVLGCEFPLMQAPLGRGAAAPLATAVSRAGGLGTLGASWTDPPLLREQIRSIARVTDRPFCVNLVLDFAQDERLALVVEERVPWVSFSFHSVPIW